jgi:ankyrin repeat protein
MVKQKVVFSFFMFFLYLMYPLCAEDIYYMPFVNSLRLRQAPSLQAKVIRLLEKYEKLKLLEKGKTEVIDNVLGTWLKVKTVQNQIGYCFDSYCVFSDGHDSSEPNYAYNVEKMLPGLWQQDFIITDVPAYEINLTKDGRYWSIFGGKKEEELRWRYDPKQNTLLFIKNSKIIAQHTIKQLSYGYMILEFREDEQSIAFAKWSTELHEAVNCGNLSKVQFLVEHGFDVNTLTFNSYTPLHLAVALDGPQANNKVAIVEYLLAKGADVNQETMYMYTPLNEVNGSYQLETTALLLSHGADINHLNNQKETLLFRRLGDTFSQASPGKPLQSDWDFILFLIDKKADITIKNNYDRSLLLPLVLEDTFLLEQVIKRAGSPSLKDNSDLLTRAAFSGYYKTAEFLLAYGVDVNNNDSQLGEAPLHIAAEEGKAEIMQLLIKKGANINITDANGDTPLHYITSSQYFHGNYETVIDILVKAGADLNIKNKLGRTPLHSATARDRREPVSILLKNHAALNLQDNEGNTALHLAVMNVHGYSSWQQYQDVIESLLCYGALTTIKNKAGKSVLDIARELNDDDLKKLLTERRMHE